MSRPKINIYCLLQESVLMFKSVKADYNREYDCYFVDVADMGKKAERAALAYEFPIFELYFEKSGTTYRCSDIYVDKQRKKTRIKFVFEKKGCYQFYNEENAAKVFSNMKLFEWPPFNPTGVMFELHSLCRNNLLRSSYIRGLYIIDDDGTHLYFCGGRIDGDSLMYTSKNLQRGYFSIFIDFEEDDWLDFCKQIEIEEMSKVKSSQSCND